MPSPPALLRAAELDQALRLRDLSDPGEGRHAIQLIVDDAVSALCRAWASAPRIQRRGRVVALSDNYDDLGYARDAITRDARYTRYVARDLVLRSHSSAMIPRALRALAHQHRGGVSPADVLLVCPGICYRRDSIDWQHTGTPHQLDLWRLVQGPICRVVDLEEMIETVVAATLPGLTWRTSRAQHPYTVSGRQIDVRVGGQGGQWVEIGECGLASRAVLAGAGLDAERWSGLAMGVGLDRLVMLRKGIPDIRLLRSPDDRVACQMLDLAPYRPVSHMPAVRRDLSIAVDAGVDTSAEALGDRVRLALGGAAETAELVEVGSETGYGDLPPAARERLGMAPGQRNVLVRLVLRSLDRSLTDDEANRLRDTVYAALHDGAVHQWAVPVDARAG